MTSELPARIHLVGVGGTGMSALAKILAARSHRVSGSDQRAGASVAMLSDLGMDVWEGSLPERVADCELVVASSAVPESDPELRAAREVGIPVWRRPRLLQVLTDELPAIGPTGTHGKTTTTALLITALRGSGFDPSFVIGGELVAMGTNAHLGDDDLLVLEVDEAFGTFEHVRLRGLIVTNLEQDHLDHFGTYDELEESFVRVVRRAEGPVVACVDDPGAARVADRTGAITYGSHPKADWRMLDFHPHEGTASFRVAWSGGEATVALPRPGRHVASNTLGVLALLGEMGYDVDAAAAGLADFAGVRRRFESRGVVGGVRIVDDYAHHPTEVGATLREASQLGARRVWAVFQPHLYSRTRDMHREFGAALARADGVVVTDVFGSRETPIPGVTGQLVAASAQRAGSPSVHYVAHRADIAGKLAGLLEPGDLVVLMGAGDITLVAAELGRALQSEVTNDLVG